MCDHTYMYISDKAHSQETDYILQVRPYIDNGMHAHIRPYKGQSHHLYGKEVTHSEAHDTNVFIVTCS